LNATIIHGHQAGKIENFAVAEHNDCVRASVEEKRSGRTGQ
jgi:hypothetical protein